MGLREEIEAAFGEAAADGGVRVLAVDDDEEVWVGGLAARWPSRSAARRTWSRRSTRSRAKPRRFSRARSAGPTR
jgi:hypothetical protein